VRGVAFSAFLEARSMTIRLLHNGAVAVKRTMTLFSGRTTMMLTRQPWAVTRAGNLKMIGG